MEPVQPSSSVNMQRVCSKPFQGPVANESTACRINEVVVDNDQSFLKGVMWGYLGTQLSIVTYGALRDTLTTTPLLLNAATAPIPILHFVRTCIVGWLGLQCFENHNYHWRSRQAKVIDVA